MSMNEEPFLTELDIDEHEVPCPICKDLFEIHRLMWEHLKASHPTLRLSVFPDYDTSLEQAEAIIATWGIDAS
jgi:hypothetical protein